MLDACGCESHLKLDGIKKPEWCNTAEEKVGVRLKSYVDSMKPCGRSEALSSGQDPLMPPMQSIKDSDGEDGAILSRTRERRTLKRFPSEEG